MNASHIRQAVSVAGQTRKISLSRYSGKVSFCLFGGMRNHRLMKQMIFVALGLLLGMLMSQAETRTFTNVDGRKAEGELLVVEDGSAVVRLGNDRIVKIPMNSLTAEDQSFVNKWWEENKDKLGPMDVRLTTDKKTERIERTVTRPKPSAGNKPAPNQVTKKLTIDDFHYSCELKNYTRKTITGLTVEYTIYKRVIGRDKDGMKNTTEEINGNKTINQLDALGSQTFDTDVVRCEDKSESGGTGPMIWKRETILGIVVTFSIGGKEIAKHSDPDNFLDRLEEEEQREISR
jgi:hypothetical protein